MLGLALQRFGGRGPFARFETQLREVDELLFAEIAEHRERPDLAEREDILSMLMHAPSSRTARGWRTRSCATS